MKVFLRIVGILLILLGWGIAVLLNFAFTGDSTDELHRLNWDVAEEQMKDRLLTRRLVSVVDAAVATPFWRHVDWAQKMMDGSSAVKQFVEDAALTEGVISIGVFNRDGSKYIKWLRKKNQDLELELEKLINRVCPLQPDTTTDPHSSKRRHPQNWMLFRFSPDTASSYEALNLLVVNDDVEDNRFSAVVFALDYDYVITQAKDCLNNYWPTLFSRIFSLVKGADYGIKIREGDDPVFIWGYPDSVVTVEHQIKVRGEVHTKLDKEKIAEYKNAVTMFGRPARLYVDLGVVVKSQGDISKLMGKASAEKMLSKLAVKANLATTTLMTLGLILILLSMRKRKKHISD